MHDRPIYIYEREYNKFINIVLYSHCDSILKVCHLLSFMSNYTQNWVYKVLNYPSVFQLPICERSTFLHILQMKKIYIS